MSHKHVPDTYAFRHRILGTLSLDSPFLGLHPGIVVAGIASIFRPAPSPPVENTPPASPASPRYTMESLSRETSAFSEPSSAQLSSLSLSSSPHPDPHDPSFNQPFFNDVTFRDRGWVKNIVHFANKHRAENIFDAAKNHILNHLDFGGVLADYPALNHRYRRLRQLEEVDVVGRDASDPRVTARVRFANYYTLSTGREKKAKVEAGPEVGPEAGPGAEPKAEPKPDVGTEPEVKTETELEQELEPKSASLDPTPGQTARVGSPDPDPPVSSPRISVEESSDDEMLEVLEPMPEEDDPPPTYDVAAIETAKTTDTKAAETLEALEAAETSEAIEVLGTVETTETRETGETKEAAETKESTEAPTADSPPSDLLEGLQLPSIPDLPEPPTAPDLSQYTDKAVQKQVEKEAKRAQKTYEQAVKARDKALKERQKLVEKHERKMLKDAEKRDKEALKEARKREKDAEKERVAEERAWQKEQQQQQQQQQQQKEPLDEAGGEKEKETEKEEKKKKKDRKFCMIPREVTAGQDPTWVPVRMVGMDEVTAHCGIFLPGPHYEELIGDVGSRVVGWVHEDATRRAVLEELRAGSA